MNKNEKLQFGDISLYSIRNNNERRVISFMSEILNEFPKYEPEILDIQDIYALTLNKLQPRYGQKLSLVLREPVKNEMIKKKLRQAIKRVIKHPNH